MNDEVPDETQSEKKYTASYEPGPPSTSTPRPADGRTESFSELQTFYGGKLDINCGLRTTSWWTRKPEIFHTGDQPWFMEIWTITSILGVDLPFSTELGLAGS